MHRDDPPASDIVTSLRGLTLDHDTVQELLGLNHGNPASWPKRGAGRATATSSQGEMQLNVCPISSCLQLLTAARQLPMASTAQVADLAKVVRGVLGLRDGAIIPIADAWRAAVAQCIEFGPTP